MSEIQDVLSTVATHPDYTEISHDEYMELWDGGDTLFDLHCETDEAGGCRAFINAIGGDEFVVDISGNVEGSYLSHNYRISPSEGIKESLRALEPEFEPLTTAPSDPTEGPFQAVFDTIEEAGHSDANPSDADSEAEQGKVFDGQYQCRWCGEVTQIGTFAGAAKPPKKVGTDCENCGGERRFDAISPDADSVLHRWVVSFDNIQRDPYRIEVTANSRTDARTQAENDRPDRSVELIHHEERIDDE